MKADFAAVRKLFPGAKVVASDLDTYMDGLASQKDKLTVVTGELAEGWIYGPLRHVTSHDPLLCGADTLWWLPAGIGSDPVKQMRMRELARARDDWVAAGAETAHPEEMALFTLLSTKNSEHTWGISSGVTDTAKTTGWDNAAFHAARRNASGNPYAAVERAWRQQRKVGIDAAVASLEGTPL